MSIASGNFPPDPKDKNLVCQPGNSLYTSIDSESVSVGNSNVLRKLRVNLFFTYIYKTAAQSVHYLAQKNFLFIKQITLLN